MALPGSPAPRRAASPARKVVGSAPAQPRAKRAASPAATRERPPPRTTIKPSPRKAAAGALELSWLGRQRAAFGLPFLTCICVVYFAQGFRALSGLATQFFLKDSLGLEPAAIQSLLATAALPWSVKPLYGLVSDAVPIRGQHRKPYLVLAAAVGLAAWSGLALLAAPGAAAASLPPLTAMALLTALLLLSNLSTALSDVVVDAMVAEAAAREAASSGGQSAAGTEGENALQSLCWGALAVGGLCGSGLGFAASAVPACAIFGLSAACPALVLAASHALSEPPHSEPRGTAGGSLAALGAAGAALLRALRLPSIYKPLCFFLLQNALVPSPAQAMLFFLTDELGFTQGFLALQGVLAYCGLLLGSVLYSRYVRGVSFLRLFGACQLAAFALSLLDVLLVSRLNLRLGIPDRLFVLGSDALSTVLSRLTMQPFLVLAARLCPPGCEASLYATFMSTYNFGHTLAGASGAALLAPFGVEKGAYAGLVPLLLVRSATLLLPLLLLKPLLGGASDRLKTD